MLQVSARTERTVSTKRDDFSGWPGSLYGAPVLQGHINSGLVERHRLQTIILVREGNAMNSGTKIRCDFCMTHFVRANPIQHLYRSWQQRINVPVRQFESNHG